MWVVFRAVVKTLGSQTIIRKKSMFNVDSIIIQFDKGLRALTGGLAASRPNPAGNVAQSQLSNQQRRHSAGLMRVNHVGEICAQALYQSQANIAHSPGIAQQFMDAGLEEQDHLSWTAERLTELNARTSFANPLWYVTSYALGTLVGRMSDAVSLGFMVETERQVEAHLASHLNRLPAEDIKSRAIVKQMQLDEAAHGRQAEKLGAQPLPKQVKYAMQAMSKIMTTVAYYL
jgi:ubiquinone biosynthesis monooxygenase Coq7